MIRKAVVPIAGLGTRLGPLARAVPKSMFPLVDAGDHIRPIIHFILDEARSAGIEQLALIVSPVHLDLLRKYFTAARKELDRDPCDWVTYINQPAPTGFGEAVARAADFVGNEPSMILLGDHVYQASAGKSTCAAQVAAAFEKHPGAAMVGMQTVGEDELTRVGVAAGKQVEDRLYRCTQFAEKPSPQTARDRLRTAGLNEGQYLAHCGIYVFGPEIFECLARLAVQDRPMGQEIQLADAQAMLLEGHPDDYYLYQIDGRSYDTGTPTGYLAAQKAIRA